MIRNTGSLDTVTETLNMNTVWNIVQKLNAPL